MKYDDAGWHYGGEFPEDSPEEFGGTHIGLFLRWCFIQGWAGELHLEQEPEAVQQVVAGTMTGTQSLFEYCDGKLTDEDLNSEGNAFASEYFGEHGSYLDDYAAQFMDLMYVSPEEEHDFRAFSSMIDEHRNPAGPVVVTAVNEKDGKKPWWKLW